MSAGARKAIDPQAKAQADRTKLRAWLEDVAAFAIDWLDELDAPFVDLEDDEQEGSD